NPTARFLLQGGRNLISLRNCRMNQRQRNDAVKYVRAFTAAFAAVPDICSARPLRLAITLVSWMFFWTSVLSAQSPGTGAITGEVFDQSEAVVPGAHVAIVNEETSQSRSVNANSDGFFRAPLLSPGNYSLTVQAPGFEKEVVSFVRVAVAETAFVK